MKRFLLPLLLCALITLSMTNNSGRGFNYQAVARTLDGQIKANQEIELQFSLYPGQQANTPSWQEVHKVNTNPFGIFSVIIGKGEKSGGFENTFADINFAIADFWLKVEVKDKGSWQQISNTQLYSSPYAEAAHNAQAAPVGSIMPFAGPADKVPEGWFLCDGRMLSRSEYAALYDVIGTAWGHGDGTNSFHIPGLGGLFLRGVDYNKNRDDDWNNRYPNNIGGNTNNNVGSEQGESFRSHSHSGKTLTGGAHSHQIYSRWGNGPKTLNIHEGAEQGNQTEFAETSTNGNHTHNIPADGGKETRPDNAYVNYIIKY